MGAVRSPVAAGGLRRPPGPRSGRHPPARSGIVVATVVRAGGHRPRGTRFAAGDGSELWVTDPSKPPARAYGYARVILRKLRNQPSIRPGWSWCCGRRARTRRTVPEVPKPDRRPDTRAPAKGRSRKSRNPAALSGEHDQEHDDVHGPGRAAEQRWRQVVGVGRGQQSRLLRTSPCASELRRENTEVTQDVTQDAPRGGTQDATKGATQDATSHGLLPQGVP